MSILLCTIIIIFALIIILMFLKGAEDGRGDYFDDIITAENVSLDRQLISSITLDELQVESALCTLDTFVCYLHVPKSIQDQFAYLLPNSDGTTSSEDALDTILVEFWRDEGTYHYVYLFEDDTVDVSKQLSCDELNTLVEKKGDYLKAQKYKKKRASRISVGSSFFVLIENSSIRNILCIVFLYIRRHFSLYSCRLRHERQLY